MKSLTLFLLLLVCTSPFNAQGQYYVHVTSSTLNLRESPTQSSQILSRLDKYDNLIVLDTVAGNWIKASLGGKNGFVHTDYIKSGKAKVTIIQGGRIGAICKDGTTSSATGRGACSHHGGVSRWRYSQRQSVTIIENK